MLQITHDAVQLLTEMRRGQNLADDVGLRVFAEAAPEPDGGEITIGLGFTEEPAMGDEVTEADGLRVFVAPELAAPLADAAIDVTPAGDGVQRLVFRPQSETGLAS